MTRNDFERNVIPVIVRIAKEKGYPFPSAIIAQAACESAWGTSALSSNYFNFFGMKCGSSYKGKSVNMKTKEEYKPGTLTTITDNFRAYDSIEEGIRGYFEFIQMARYLNLKQASSPEDYITRLKNSGWATSSTYINTLTKIMNDNGLKKYDGANIPVAPVKDKSPVISAVKSLQTVLNNYGNYGLVVDGIIGPKTETAYKQFRGN